MLERIRVRCCACVVLGCVGMWFGMESDGMVWDGMV